MTSEKNTPITNEPQDNSEEIPQDKSEFVLINTGVRVIHEGWSKDSNVQNIVNYAYKLGGYDFLAVLECENGSYKLNAKGDSGHAHGLCQMNDRFHKDIPADYTTNWVVAVEYCYQKWKKGTVYYGPQRMIKGKRCYEYVKDRFTFIE